MKKNYRIQLMITLILFTFTIASTITAIDYFKFKKEMERKNDMLMEQVIEVSVAALQFVDQSIHLQGNAIDEEMKETLFYLQDYYEANKDISTWDLHRLTDELGYDIYLINEYDEIVQSNIDNDVGINFEKCCTSLKKVLDERRKSDQPFIDGIEISQKNQNLIKFGYITTKDKRYIIEIGLQIEDTPLEAIYNYVNITSELVEQFDIVEDLHVLNMGGYSYNAAGEQLSGKRLRTFMQARDTNETKELTMIDDSGEQLYYRYVPLMLPYDQGTTKQKIIEVTYNEAGMGDWITAYTKRFIYQMIFILLITIILANMIVKRFMRLSYLAYHDGLTGLENRLAFDEQIEQMIKKSEDFAVCFLDLDRFKLVNDYLGHQKGDALLSSVGKTMKGIVENGTVYRLGGDEFMIIFTNVTREEVFEQVKHVLVGVEKELIKDKYYETFQLSASAGIAFGEPDDTVTSIKTKVDVALQQAKLKGKNQYQVYEVSENTGNHNS